MNRIYVFKLRNLLIGVFCLTAIAATLIFYRVHYARAALNPLPNLAHQPGGPRVIHMVTAEIKTTTKDGKVIESYRWDPGTIFVNLGETVKLDIYGVSGDSHFFMIEGTHIQGEVKKGKETIVTFTGTKKGVYRLICITHPDIAHSGPMIAYIIVQ